MQEYNPLMELNEQIEAVQREVELEKSKPYTFRSGPKEPSKAFASLRKIMGLSFLALFCYVSLHYVPAFFNPFDYFSKVSSSPLTRLDAQEDGNFVKRLIASKTIKKTYVRRGQTLQVQYTRPKDATLELYIKRCRSIVVLEVFDCKVVGEKVVQLNEDSNGTQRFIFESNGFYRLEEKLLSTSPNQDYRIVWSRT